MNCLCFWCSRVRVDVEWMLSFDVLKRQRFDARTVDKGIAKVILQRTRTVYFDIEAFCGALIREENFVHGRFEKLRRAAATIMADLFLTVDESIYAVHPDLVPTSLEGGTGKHGSLGRAYDSEEWKTWKSELLQKTKNLVHCVEAFNPDVSV